MNKAKKITEWIKFTIYTIAVAIVEITLMLSVIASNDNKILLYILLFIIQFIIVMLTVIERLIKAIKGPRRPQKPQELKQKIKQDTIEGVFDIIEELIDVIN